MSNSPQQEKELILLLAKGSELAFEQIYRLYSNRLYGNLFKLLKSEIQAQEILQEVFLKIWERRESIDAEKSFRSFLFIIAENKVHDFFRKTARNKKATERLIDLSIEASMNIEELSVADGKSALLQRAIDALPAQRQQVFRLCKLEGKSYDEVGKLLGISASTISDHIVKGTKSVRDYVNTHYKDLPAIIFAFYLIR